jgi:hypothetical protein
MDRRLLYALGAVALGGALFTGRRQVVSLFGTVVASGKELAFRLTLPGHAQPYADVIIQVSRETGLDPYLLFALGDRESLWGETLSPRGPGGVGDNGHGHGLMQVDDRSWGAWLNSNNWADPLTNVRKGAAILRGKLAFFQGRSAVKGYTDGRLVQIDVSAERLGVAPGYYPDPRPLAGDALWRAGIAAYNTGEGNVLMALAAGHPAEYTTAGGDYVSDVITRGADAAAKLA